MKGFWKLEKLSLPFFTGDTLVQPFWGCIDLPAGILKIVLIPILCKFALSNPLPMVILYVFPMRSQLTLMMVIMTVTQVR